MSIFMTGGTGFIGSYVLDQLLDKTDERITLLIRAKDRAGAEEKLWKALQNHRNAESFFEGLERIDFAFGDLTAPKLGFDDAVYDRLVKETSSFLHIAASLNRKSAKACFNHNLRGSLSVINLARAAHEHHGLRRFDHVSTAAIAGHRSHEVLTEDQTLDWERSDYDTYARTKKFVEHMCDELLPDVQRVVYRPTTIMGDSRHPRTTAFDMTRAFATLADLPIVPMDGRARVDIANVDWVSKVISTVFLQDKPAHDAYSLSSGVASNTADEIANRINHELGRRPTRFVRQLDSGFKGVIEAMNALPGRNAITYTGALLKVFWPYITYDTVFDNSRAVAALGGELPLPFVDYCTPLYKWVKQHGYRYPHAPMPARPELVSVPSEVRA